MTAYGYKSAYQARRKAPKGNKTRAHELFPGGARRAPSKEVTTILATKEVKK